MGEEANSAAGRFWDRIGHRSGIWLLNTAPGRIFLYWDIESIWLEQVSRHFSTDWNRLAYYAAVGDGAERVVAVRRLSAETRSVYMDLSDADGVAGWAQWGIWAEDRRFLALLRTRSSPFGLPRWPWSRVFDGYGEARPLTPRGGEDYAGW